MANPSKLYLNEHFSIENAKYCTLLIQIGVTDFSFAIVNKDEMTAWGKNLSLTELTAVKDLRDYIDAEFASVVIGLTPTDFTIITKQLYQEESVTDYARVLNVADFEKVYTQSLDDKNMVLFKDNDQIVPVLQKKYKNTRVAFFYKGWIKAVSNANPEWQNFYIDIQPETLSVLYLKNGKLRFYNSFNYQSTEELVYFIALVTTELQLKQHELKLILSGNVAKGDRTMAALAEFYPRVEINQTELKRLPYSISPQQVLSITALSLCV